MAIVAGILLVVFWLGAAFCFVVFEPAMRRRAYEAMERRFVARLRVLEGRLALYQVEDDFRRQGQEYATACLPVIEAEGE